MNHNPPNNPEDQGMTKYAVDTSSPGQSKTASSEEDCPLCGKRVVRHGRVKLCPTHGSAPFERA